MKKLKFLLLEIFIGIILISLLTFMGVSYYFNKFGNFEQYSVFFNDVNGLSVGSPVRYMGHQIGHVSELKLLGSEVKVTFKVTDKNIKIPKGTVVGIEFTGLAGSKSLELVSSGKEVKNANLFLPINPTRMSNVTKLQNITAKILVDFNDAILQFIEKNADEESRKEIVEATSSINNEVDYLHDSFQRFKGANPDLTENSQNLRVFVEKNNAELKKLANSVNELTQSEEMKANVESLKESFDKIVKAIESGEAQEKISTLKSDLKDFEVKISQINEKLKQVKDKEIKYISEFNESIKSTTSKIKDLVNKTELMKQGEVNVETNIKTLEK